MLRRRDRYNIVLGGSKIGYNLGFEGSRRWHTRRRFGTNTFKNRKGRAGDVADGIRHRGGTAYADKRDCGIADHPARDIRAVMGFDTYKLCGVALISSAAVFFLRNIKKEYEVPLTLAGSILLIAAAFGMAEPIVGYIGDLSEALPMAGEAFAVLMRAVGIAMLTRVAADICRDMGTPSVASSLELTARLEIVVLTLPLISLLLDSIRALLAEAGL